MPNIFNNDTSLSTRLRNINKLDITENVIVSINEFDTAQTIPVSSTGQQILNSVSLDELKTLLLEQTQEAIVYSNADGQREINFHIKSADEDLISSSNLRLSIQEDQLRIYDDIIPQVGSRDLGDATHQFGSFYGSNIKVARIYNKEGATDAEIYLDLASDNLLTYKHFLPQTASLNLGSASSPFQNVFISDSIVASGATPVSFNGQKYSFFTQGSVNKRVEINNTNSDFTGCSVRVLGNDKTLTLGSTNFTEHLKIGYLTVGGLRTSINSLTVPLHITTGSNQDIEITPNGTGETNINSNLSVDGIMGATKGKIGTTATAFGKLSVKTTPSALYEGNVSWTDEYFTVGETDLEYVENSQTKYGLCVGIGINTADANPINHYGVIKCIEPTNAWRPLHFSASSIELDHQGTQKLSISADIQPRTHIYPINDNLLDLGRDDRRYRDIYTGTQRVFGSGGFIDMRGRTYTQQGEGTDTTPIYFNTGYYVGGNDQSTTRKSMILGRSTANTFPNTREVSGNGRNNIVFCVNNQANNSGR